MTTTTLNVIHPQVIDEVVASDKFSSLDEQDQVNFIGDLLRIKSGENFYDSRFVDRATDYAGTDFRMNRALESAKYLGDLMHAKKIFEGSIHGLEGNLPGGYFVRGLQLYERFGRALGYEVSDLFDAQEKGLNLVRERAEKKKDSGLLNRVNAQLESNNSIRKEYLAKYSGDGQLFSSHYLQLSVNEGK